jgi:hypothetical protein
VIIIEEGESPSASKGIAFLIAGLALGGILMRSSARKSAPPPGAAPPPLPQ